MATELYEQQHADPHHVGRDVEIAYPSVSSCITVTFCFPEWMTGGPILVGGHFGMYDGLQQNGSPLKIQRQTMTTMMTQIMNLLPGTQKQKYAPTNYLVIGQISSWGVAVPNEKVMLYDWVKKIAGRTSVENDNCWDIGADGFQSGDVRVKANGQIIVTGSHYVVRGTRDVVDPFGDHYPIPNQILENFTRRRLFTL